ncbi:MAG: DNA-binding transcriptional ArsR family regulator [Nitriliruptoraceae bacterium]|jgi:DNA-binding transcriptional ArsR family regulator
MTEPGWTFLSNHGHVMVCLRRDLDARVRDIAVAVGLTERAVASILRDLVEAGYVEKERLGRRNHYMLHPELPMRHPLEEGHVLGELLGAISPQHELP